MTFGRFGVDDLIYLWPTCSHILDNDYFYCSKSAATPWRSDSQYSQYTASQYVDALQSAVRYCTPASERANNLYLHAHFEASVQITYICTLTSNRACKYRLFARSLRSERANIGYLHAHSPGCNIALQCIHIGRRCTGEYCTLSKAADWLKPWKHSRGVR